MDLLVKQKIKNDNAIEKFIVDPWLLNTTIDNLKLFDPEITFICVPTPMGLDGNQDSEIIETVVEELAAKCPETIHCSKKYRTSICIDKVEGHIQKCNL